MLHAVRPGAARLVGATDLHALPGEAPALLGGAWICESTAPDVPLFGTPSALGGYALEGVMYLLSFDYPDGARVARWTPRWTGEDLAESVPVDRSPLLDDVDTHHEWARKAARVTGGQRGSRPAGRRQMGFTTRRPSAAAA